jgi:hypothetical protein
MRTSERMKTKWILVKYTYNNKAKAPRPPNSIAVVYSQRFAGTKSQSLVI